MNNTKEYPKLEPIPGVNLSNPDDEKKKEKINDMDQQTINTINKLRQKISYNSRNKKLFRRNSQIPSLSMNFLSNFILVNEKQTIKEEEWSEESSDKLSEESSTLQKNQSVEKQDNRDDPFYLHKMNLHYKIDSLKQAQGEVREKFKKESEAYKNKIKSLETMLNSSYDENELENLQRINQKNKELIKDLENQIEEKEKMKMREEKSYNDKLNETIKLKNILIKELNELEILTKEISKNKLEYEDPIKLVKMNFEDNDTKLYNKDMSLEKEENSSEQEDPFGFSNQAESNLQNNSHERLPMSNTEKYFFDNKNFLPSNDNSITLDNLNNVLENNNNEELSLGNNNMKGNNNKEKQIKSSSQPIFKALPKRFLMKDQSNLSKDLVLIRDPTDESNFL